MYIYGEIFIIGLLGAMSPGADFLVVLKNALSGKKTMGIAAALGVCCALTVHISYTIAGVSILQQSRMLFMIVQLCGGVYLLYLAKNLLLKGVVPQQEAGSLSVSKSLCRAFKEGFVCNLLNPKVAVYFLGIFSQFLTADMSLVQEYFLGLEVIAAAFIWFVGVSVVITQRAVYARYMKYHIIIEKILGCALAVIAVRLFYAMIYKL